jgi:thiamine-monophosphate kinase
MARVLYNPSSAGPPAPTVRVADLGEFGLIERLARIAMASSRDPLAPPRDGNLGIGDDAASWSTDGSTEVLTTDALIENVHFRHSTTTWFDLGWKALAENISDIAAMGARPRRAFVTLGVTGATLVADLEEMYRGIRSICDVYDVEIAGGDTVSAPITVISVTVVGSSESELLRRSAAKPGDLLAVTGTLGGSAGGLALLERGGAPEAIADRQLVEIHRRPSPRVREGLALVASGVRCGMDVSDGVLGDAQKIARASGLTATIRLADLPLPLGLLDRFGEEPARRMALAGGEDYELLVAADAQTLETAARQLASAGLQPLTVVGSLEAGPAGEVRVVDASGHELADPKGSWDHFR